MELADVQDSKSCVREDVRVRPPPPAVPYQKPSLQVFCKEGFVMYDEFLFQESVNDHVLGLCLGEPE